MTIGNSDDAFEIHLYAVGAGGDRVLDISDVGHGESRRVYELGGVAYKVGRDSANEYEHRMLTAWRAAGAAWAPQTSLYRGEDPFIGPYTVLAMTYLPDDGGQLDEAALAEIKRVAPQVAAENLHSHGGQTYLIDGVDIEALPAGPKEEQ